MAQQYTSPTIRLVAAGSSLAAAILVGCSTSHGGSSEGAADAAADIAVADDAMSAPDRSLPDADDNPQPDAADSEDAAGEDAQADAGDTADGDAEGRVNRSRPVIDLNGVTGFQLAEMTYVVPGLNTERTVDVHLWYPTEDTEGEPARFNLFVDDYALQDAAFLAPDEENRAPLLVYSHGGRGFAGQISTVARQFVHNGWIVVAPSHAGDTLFEPTGQQPASFAAVRTFDVLQAIDWVANLPEEHPLHGRVDTTRVLSMGHSYGGQNSWILNGLALDLDGLRARCVEPCTPEDIAAYEAVTHDPRIVAGVSLDCTIDANLVPDAGFADVAAPMLHMSGTEGNHAVGIFERAAEANLTWVSLDGGCHESFTGTLVCPTLPFDEGLSATATYTIAFGTRHVLGSSDPDVMGILDGTIGLFASAEVFRTERAQ